VDGRASCQKVGLRTKECEWTAPRKRATRVLDRASPCNGTAGRHETTTDKEKSTLDEKGWRALGLTEALPVYFLQEERP